MKRKNNLYCQIADLDNLLLAFYKASKGKHYKKSTKEYEVHLHQNLCNLQKQILNQKINLGDYRFFKIVDPKERTICAAPFEDRVLHHAIMNVCETIFENFQIYDSYACRKGKGTQKAVKRAFYFAKKYKYCLKLDMRKYFDSVSHQKLQELLQLKFKDKKLLSLFEKILDSYSVTPNRGLPIGNLTSQHFANFYLAFFDRYAKEILKIKGYIRYMDDILIFANTKFEYKELLLKSKIFLEETLLLTVKPVIVCKTKIGIPFLGFLIKPNCIRFLQAKKRRIKKRLARYSYNLKCGFWSEEEFALHALPTLSSREWLV